VNQNPTVTAWDFDALKIDDRNKVRCPSLKQWGEFGTVMEVKEGFATVKMENASRIAHVPLSGVEWVNGVPDVLKEDVARVQSDAGQSALDIPTNVMAGGRDMPQHDNAPDQMVPEHASGATIAKALWDYVAGEEGELGFKEGDHIVVDHMDDSGWWTGSCHGLNGCFPSNRVELIPVENTASQAVYTPAADAQKAAYENAYNTSGHEQAHAQLQREAGQVSSGGGEKNVAPGQRAAVQHQKVFAVGVNPLAAGSNDSWMRNRSGTASSTGSQGSLKDDVMRTKAVPDAMRGGYR